MLTHVVIRYLGGSRCNDSYLTVNLGTISKLGNFVHATRFESYSEALPWLLRYREPPDSNHGCGEIIAEPDVFAKNKAV